MTYQVLKNLSLSPYISDLICPAYSPPALQAGPQTQSSSELHTDCTLHLKTSSWDSCDLGLHYLQVLDVTSDVTFMIRRVKSLHSNKKKLPDAFKISLNKFL